MSNYIIYNGDYVTEAENIPNESVDLLITDPPFGSIKNGFKGVNSEICGLNNAKYAWDAKLDFDIFFKIIARILKPGGQAVLFSQNKLTAQLILTGDKYLRYAYTSYWLKDSHSNPLRSRSGFLFKIEDITLYKKNVAGHKSTYNFVAHPNVFEIKKPTAPRWHPTQKPTELLQKLIEAFSNPGDTVADVTMGSGSTGVAALNTGRKFVGIELDPHFFKISKHRLDYANFINSLCVSE